MSKLSFVITDPAVGGTFISWSIEYLAGHECMYSVCNNSYISLPDNPIQKYNAHIYKPNQFDISSDVNNAIKQLTNLNDKYDRKIDLIYMHPYFWNVDKHADWFTTMRKIVDADRPIVLIKLLKPYLLYHGLDEKRAPTFFKRGIRAKGNTTFDLNVSEFFNNDDSKWKELGLTEIYDKREFLSLNMRPFDSMIYDNMFNQYPIDSNILSLCAIDVWQMLDSTIYDVMNFLNVDIDADRYATWKIVYEEWKNIHEKRIKWCWYYDQIIEYIINGHSMDLVRFDLDLMQEATIQHTLIYEYNLNLKTYKLDKFDNTKQLYNLLEPNIHPLHTYEHN